MTMYCTVTQVIYFSLWLATFVSSTIRTNTDPDTVDVLTQATAQLLLVALHAAFTSEDITASFSLLGLRMACGWLSFQREVYVRLTFHRTSSSHVTFHMRLPQAYFCCQE